ncbi:hypothetical protein J3458_019477 [Metarhizium acridum]|uniref:uncharacterized protein n=1 Tax=Metarhizium acridum TaxID=92637 RepID=UPI001C6B6CE5|nr:hypothetical protein J3458_019477 [Metarhizium acridum]
MEVVFILLGIACVALYFFLYSCLRSNTRLPLPPGPTRLPIVGNILSLPPKGVLEYEHWLKFKNLYGPISSVTVLGQTTIILHGKKEVEDLLENMSTETSDRPLSIFANMTGFDRFFRL